MYSKSHM